MCGRHGLVYALLLLCAMGCVCGRRSGQNNPSPSGGNSTPNNSPASSLTSVTAYQLVREFEENQATAEQRYNGQILRIVGPAYLHVSGIQVPRNYGSRYVLFHGSNDFQKFVECILDDAQNNAFTGFVPGSSMTIQGQYAGVRRDGARFFVTLRNCTSASWR